MDMREKEVKIYYKHENGIIDSWDKALEDVLSILGLKRWASGFDLTNGVRDLAFKYKKEGD